MTTSLQVPTALYSPEAEEAVVSAVMTHGALYPVLARFLSPSDFFLLRVSYYWQAFARLQERAVPIDYLTVIEELRAMGKLNDVGGVAAVTEMGDKAPTHTLAVIYARFVQRAALRRCLLAHFDQLRAAALDEKLDVETIIGRATLGLKKIADVPLVDDTLSSIHDSTNRFLDDVVARMEGRLPPRLSSGYPVMDELVDSLPLGDVTVIAGRTSMGKTALALNIGANVARAGGKTLFCSMEMSEKQMMARLMGMETGIDTRRLQGGKLSGAEYTRVMATAGDLAKLPMTFDYTSRATPASVRAKGERLSGLRLLILDGLWLMDAEQKYEREEQRFSAISRGVKELARDLGVHVLLLHQLNRNPEHRADKRPLLSDLRESGEQDADMVWLLYRPAYYDDASLGHPGRTEIAVAKHRNGALGTVTLYLDFPTQKFLSGAGTTPPQNAREKENDFANL